MHVIAGASPDNTPAGYYWTFLFPMILFIVIALILWALFGRPHQRVPAQRLRLRLSTPGTGSTGFTATAAAPAAPGVAPVGGGSESAGAEPEAPPEASHADGGQSAADGAGAGE